MKNKLIIAIAAITLTMLTGCNTMNGLGQDIEDAGDNLQDAAN